jgi:hypothetical protein
MRLLAMTVMLLATLAAGRAEASLVIRVDKTQQQMSVVVDGVPRHVWPVSTGRAGYGTPSGAYRPQRLARTWFSRKYYNSPMPYSIFFHGGFAIHGSYEIARLGGPASHGCIRLHPSHAAQLFALVNAEGMADTRIVVTGSEIAARRRLAPPVREPRAVMVPAAFGRPPPWAAPAPSYGYWPRRDTWRYPPAALWDGWDED